MDADLPAVGLVDLLHDLVETLYVLELSIVRRPKNGDYPCEPLSTSKLLQHSIVCMALKRSLLVSLVYVSS